MVKIKGVTWVMRLQSLSVVLGFLFIAALIQMYCGKSSEEVALQEKVYRDNDYFYNLKDVILYHGDVWYIVDINTVSTQQNGQGMVVKLDQPLKIKWGYTKNDLPERNKKIRFYVKSCWPPSEEFNEGYTIIHGLLSYEYLN